VTITRVSGQEAVGSSNVITLPNNPSLGNLVIVCYSTAGAVGTPTVKDANNNTYTQTPGSPHTDNTSGWCVGIAYLKNAPANANKVINFTFTGSAGFSQCTGSEYAGADTTAPFEAEAFSPDGSNSTPTIALPSFTPGASTDLLICSLIVNNSLSSVGSPWTSITAFTGIGQDAIPASVTAVTPNDLDSVTSDNYTAQIAAFKVAGVASFETNPLFIENQPSLSYRSPLITRLALLRQNAAVDVEPTNLYFADSYGNPIFRMRPRARQIYG
jgi:hypothetical protein